MSFLCQQNEKNPGGDSAGGRGRAVRKLMMVTSRKKERQKSPDIRSGEEKINWSHVREAEQIYNSVIS